MSKKELKEKNLSSFFEYLTRKLKKLEKSFEDVKIENGKLKGFYVLSVNGINVCYGTPKELESFVQGASMLRSFKFA